jgi:hypothetical protein
LVLNYPVCFLGHFQSYLASTSCLIPIFCEKIEFFSYLHVARDTAHAEFEVRATFAVRLLALTLFSNTKGKEDKEDSDMDTGDETALEHGRQLLDEADSPARTGTKLQQQLREPGTPPANMPPDATRNKIKINQEIRLSLMKKLSKSCASVVDIPSETDSNLITTKSTSADPISNSGVPTAKENPNKGCILTFPDPLQKNIRHTEKTYPDEYYAVRKMRLNSEKSKELTSVDGTSRRAGTPRGLPPGFELAEDDRHLKVKNFHIPAFKRNVSSSVDNSGGQLMCVLHCKSSL